MDQIFIDRVHEGLNAERQRKAPPADFPELPPIPAGRYLDPEFLRLEQDRLWARSWLYACHADQVPDAGSYMLLGRHGAPVIVVRGHDREIRAFYNSCRHRGGPLVRESSGRLNGGFQCAFHGWGYDLEGNLKGVRDQQDFVGLDMECLGLINVRCERLGKWVFINEDPEAPALNESLGPIAGQLAPFELDRIRHVHSSSHMVECNVKTMLEAFLEVYHLQTVHPVTAGRFLDYQGSHNILWPNGHSLMATPNRDPDWEDPGTRGMVKFSQVSEMPDRINISYNIYPGLITPVATTGIPFLTFWPMGERSARIDCHWFSPDWGSGDRHPLWDQRIENFERILGEDLELGEGLQSSVESKGFTGCRLNYQERRIYHWHEELDRRIGAGLVPEHLRVEPLLEGMIDPASTTES